MPPVASQDHLNAIFEVSLKSLILRRRRRTPPGLLWMQSVEGLGEGFGRVWGRVCETFWDVFGDRVAF